jgi:hypothetical protein
VFVHPDGVQQEMDAPLDALDSAPPRVSVLNDREMGAEVRLGTG